MRKFTNIEYNIEVEHSPGGFEQDMDFLSSNVKSAYEHYQNLKKRYPKQKITITRITTEIRKEIISRNTLEKLAEL